MMKRFVNLALAILFALSTLVSGVALSPTVDCGTIGGIWLAECENLEALYTSTYGPHWTNHTNWWVTKDPSNWYGVGVTGGHVTSLRLANNNLRGSLPPELGNLRYLNSVYFEDNHIGGNIPPELGNLNNLQILRLNNNQFDGVPPNELISLTNLFDAGMTPGGGDGLDLDYNHFNVPPDYPNSANTFHIFLFQKDPNWHLRQTILYKLFLPGLHR
jgi:hypothetical protein